MSAKALGFVCALLVLLALSALNLNGQMSPFTKAQVGDRIRKVEDGVDNFRKYLDSRGDGAKQRVNSAQDNGRPGPNGGPGAQARKNQASQTKDDLDDAMDDLNRSTNRLRRQFDPTDKWMETRTQMNRVMDDARRVNQIMGRGKYGTQAARYWSVLRGSINDLARCYGLNPMAG
jgi:hypothetical protein